MINPEKQTSFLADIEARQNDALHQLDKLNARVEKILLEYLPAREDKIDISNTSDAA